MIDGIFLKNDGYLGSLEGALPVPQHDIYQSFLFRNTKTARGV